MRATQLNFAPGHQVCLPKQHASTHSPNSGHKLVITLSRCDFSSNPCVSGSTKNDDQSQTLHPLHNNKSVATQVLLGRIGLRIVGLNNVLP